VLISKINGGKKMKQFEEFVTNKFKDVHVCMLGYETEDGANKEVSASEVEYCIASGYVKIVSTENVYVTHISNVVIKANK